MKKTFKVKLTESAQADITEIWEYIATDSARNATEFIKQVEQRILALERFPLKNPLIPENEYLNTGYRHAAYKDYRVIYRVSGDIVYVLRVIHGSKLLEMD